jgi:hypothetical protein
MLGILLVSVLRCWYVGKLVGKYVGNLIGKYIGKYVGKYHRQFVIAVLSTTVFRLYRRSQL